LFSMALRAVPDHPKFAEFKSVLRLPRGEALGWLECIWHFTVRFTPQGNIGKYSDAAIEAWCEWGGEPGALIAALIQSGWLDEDPGCRLLVHDWATHADKATKNALSRAKLSFCTPTVRTEYIQRPYEKPDSSTASRLPVPEPEPEPEPASAPALAVAQTSHRNGFLPAVGPPSFFKGPFHDDAEMVATAVIDAIGVTTWAARDQIVKQAEHELKASTDTGQPASVEKLRVGMIGQWMKYRECVREGKVRFDWNAERFFGDGRWKDSKEWQLKKGASLNGTLV
jgi:hypothetical protein